ncbi:MAG: helix-turn-helix domain-containing protein [Mycobacteriaceae bacterium]|uniref:helix-turn-helix domain-containing protein n=1 Tax=Corynebacterium sp. TaxID=1720 RepID=UPI003F9C98A4
MSQRTRTEDTTVVPFRSCDSDPGTGRDDLRPDRLWREALGEEIHRQRTRREDRLKDTAERAGISPQYLSELERGMKDPSSEVLEAVAGALGKSSFELVRSTVHPVSPTNRSARMAGPSTGPANPVLLAA